MQPVTMVVRLGADLVLVADKEPPSFSTTSRFKEEFVQVTTVTGTTIYAPGPALLAKRAPR